MIYHLAIILGLGFLFNSLAHTKESTADPFLPQVERFLALDKETPPPHQAIPFIGSSSIKRWDTKAAFSRHHLNRGIGGTGIKHLLCHADKILLPYKPKTIVIYSGDNDITHGQSPEQVFENFTKLHQLISKELPSSKIIFLSIKPSVARWALWDKMLEANQLIKDYCLTQNNIEFCDVSTPMLKSDSELNTSLFVQDGIHMNEKGYSIWEMTLKPFLR